MSEDISRLAADLLERKQRLHAFFFSSTWARNRGRPGVCDFAVGNPHEMPLPGLEEALKHHLSPRSPEHFAYKTSEPHAESVVASSLRERYGIGFAPGDVVMTTGAFAGLAISIRSVVDPGDEVVYVTPSWFNYDEMILVAGGEPVTVPLDPPGFDLDLDRLAKAMGDRTRAVIVNTPHNPTGRVYDSEALRGLAGLLREVSERNGRTVYLISDEAYSRIVYDDLPFTTPVAFYPHSFLVYTYGKVLLAPGQRIGYVVLSPEMPQREEVRAALWVSSISGGWLFPNALLQHAVGDLDGLSIDVKELQTKRDRMVEALTEMGYEVTLPEGTFYLLVRSPIEDDFLFTQRLADRDVFVLPGSLVDAPGHFRISLTATHEMVERALEGFENAIDETR
jgi:aspartate aminotransferase